MPEDAATSTRKSLPSVFLSYASQDRQAAQLIRDALLAHGLDAWYDESALDGGDVWDQKIRRQIRECDFFMPVISAQTEVRSEGYFRREWRLAVERTLDMADDHIFLLPVVIDDTSETGARVPERFFAVQWTWMPEGKPTPAFEALCKRLASGQISGLKAAKRSRDSAPAGAGSSSARAPAVQYPEFPKQEPGRKAEFYGRAGLWVVQSGWISFNRLPRWVRYVAYAWLFVLLIRGCHSEAKRTEKISPAEASKLKEISDNFRNAGGELDVGKLAATIAKSFPAEADRPTKAHSPLLAVPFSAPSGDAAAQKLADATFAQVYGRVSITHRGQVGLPAEPLPPGDFAAAVDRGRTQHASYILYGEVGPQSATQSLTVKLVEVEDGSVSWSGSYPVASADSARIAAEVDAKVPSLEDE